MFTGGWHDFGITHPEKVGICVVKYQILFTDKKYDIMSRKDLGKSFVLWEKIIEGLRRFGFGKFGNATAV